MTKSADEVELIDYLLVLWKRKWLILGGTLSLLIFAAVLCFVLPPIWEVDAIFLPSRFVSQNEQGNYEEILVTDAKQVAGQIEQESFNNLIAAELSLDIKKFPKLRAENLKDTNLVRISVKDKNPDRATSIINSLFEHVKEEMDRKINAEVKAIDTRISANEKEIQRKELDIKSKEIEISRIRQEIVSLEKKMKISEERFASIAEEMKAVKQRIDAIEKQQQETLSQQKEGANALGLLLYSNEIQRNFQYYNTLDEKLSNEKITQENLRYAIQERGQEIKQLQTQIEKLNSEIEIIRNENELFRERKQRYDHAQLVKKPTVSVNPVFPNKLLFLLVAAIAGPLLFAFAAFFVEYLNQKTAEFKS